MNRVHLFPYCGSAHTEGKKKNAIARDVRELLELRGRHCARVRLEVVRRLLEHQLDALGDGLGRLPHGLHHLRRMKITLK